MHAQKNTKKTLFQKLQYFTLRDSQTNSLFKGTEEFETYKDDRAHWPLKFMGPQAIARGPWALLIKPFYEAGKSSLPAAQPSENQCGCWGSVHSLMAKPGGAQWESLC